MLPQLINLRPCYNTKQVTRYHGLHRCIHGVHANNQCNDGIAKTYPFPGMMAIIEASQQPNHHPGLHCTESTILAYQTVVYFPLSFATPHYSPTAASHKFFFFYPPFCFVKCPRPRHVQSYLSFSYCASKPFVLRFELRNAHHQLQTSHSVQTSLSFFPSRTNPHNSTIVTNTVNLSNSSLASYTLVLYLVQN